METAKSGLTINLSNVDGNAFAIIGHCRLALRRGGRSDLVEPFTADCMSGDYDHVLRTVGEYFEVQWDD